MSISDLETAIRLGLRMCILIYNDSSYAAEVHYFRRQGFSIDIVQFPETDFAAIARGYGARGTTVRTLADLDPVRAWVAEGAPGVFVIDGKMIRISKPTGTLSIFHREPRSIPTCRSRKSHPRDSAMRQYQRFIRESLSSASAQYCPAACTPPAAAWWRPGAIGVDDLALAKPARLIPRRAA